MVNVGSLSYALAVSPKKQHEQHAAAARLSRTSRALPGASEALGTRLCGAAAAHGSARPSPGGGERMR